MSRALSRQSVRKEAVGPAISVIIPTYNREDLLGKALESVLAQTLPAAEIIVVDDGSSDGTAELAGGYGNRVRYIRQENRGPAAARNRGIGAAGGDLLAFLDSDDRFAPDKLEVQARAMAEHPGYLISHTEEIWYRRGKLLNQKKRHRKPGGFIFPHCLRLCVVSMSTVMVRRELFDRIGCFDEELPCCEDYDLWLRTSVSFPFLKIEEPLTLKDGGRPDEVSVRFRVGMDRFRIRALTKVLDAGELDGEMRRLAAAELARKCRIYGYGCIKHGRPGEGERYLRMAAETGF